MFTSLVKSTLNINMNTYACQAYELDGSLNRINI